MTATVRAERVDHATSDEVNARRAGEVLTDAQALAIASWWQSSGTVGSVLAELASTRQADLAPLLADIARTVSTDRPAAADLRGLLDLYAWAVARAQRPDDVPMPPADRVPVVWGDACRYCQRYRRPCGRHESAAVSL